MKNIILACSALFLISCNDVDGLLKVFSDFSLESNGDMFVVQEGNRDATIKFKADDRLQLRTIVDGKRRTFDFNLADDYDFPRRNGSFSIAAEDNSQGYDIQGRVQTDVERSRTYRDRERCTYTRYRTRCRTLRNGRRVCDRRAYRVNGRRDVSYYDEVTERSLRLSLESEGTRLAKFEARDVSRRRVEFRRGRCY